MLERTPEPELMDDAAQAEAYAKADFSEPHEHFVELFRECFPDPVEDAVLDLGCGPGDIACRFARAYPSATVHGLDAAEAMLAWGDAMIRKHGVAGRVRLFRGYLPGADLPRSKYAVIISNSLLHHLADPRVLWNSIREYAAGGARVFVQDLMRPESEATARALTQTYAGDEAPLLRRDFLHSLHAAYTVEEVRRQLAGAGLEHFQVRPVSDRHWIAWGRL